MLKTRIIPTLLWKDVGLVKGISFDSWRRIGSVLPAIKVYNTRQVDELILLDITAGKDSRDPDFDCVNEFSAECFVPLTVGGGISSVDHIRKMLRSGADKIAINSAAYDTPDLIDEGAKKFGAQCIVVSIDVKKAPDGSYVCHSGAGTKPETKDLIPWVKELESRGAGEILITSIERDGTMQGYDLDLIGQVASAVSIPVIASGGAGDFAHMYDALSSGASAIAAASIFHFTENTPMEAKEFLKNKGIPVRDVNKSA